jgi:hypothetical protein
MISDRPRLGNRLRVNVGIHGRSPVLAMDVPETCAARFVGFAILEYIVDSPSKDNAQINL